MLNQQPSSGKIRFFSSYKDLYTSENSSKYIVLARNQQVILLHRLEDDSETILEIFPRNAFSEEEYALTIWKCRQIVNNDEVIWVEKPLWMLNHYYRRSSSNRKYY